MAELFLYHDANTYLFDSISMKLFRLEGDQSTEINNPEIVRNVRLFSTEISREQAIKMAEDCYNLKTSQNFYNILKSCGF